MEIQVFEHTNEALAFITLYKAMPSEIKKEVKEMIINEIDNEEAAVFTNFSLQSWDADNVNLEESQLWEKFYNESKNVV